MTSTGMERRTVMARRFGSPAGQSREGCYDTRSYEYRRDRNVRLGHGIYQAEHSLGSDLQNARSDQGGIVLRPLGASCRVKRLYICCDVAMKLREVV